MKTKCLRCKRDISYDKTQNLWAKRDGEWIAMLRMRICKDMEECRGYMIPAKMRVQE